MTRELQSLKAQMQEMRNMLRMSFDMQLDIQRAIRQEVAAAMAAHLGELTFVDHIRVDEPLWLLKELGAQTYLHTRR